MIHAHSIGPYEARQRAEALARRQRMFSTQRAPETRETAKPTLGLVESAKPPAGRIWSEQHDSHVKAFYDWYGNQPLGFLKMRCREIGVSFSDIIGGSRAADIVIIRHGLITEVHKRFPEYGLAPMSRLFNRDRSSIRLAITKGGGDYHVRHRHEVHEASIVALYNTGMMQKDIAERVGCAASAVSRVLDNHFPGRPKPKRIDEFAARVEALFDEGTTYAEIGYRLGFDPSAVSKFIKKQGWKR